MRAAGDAQTQTAHHREPAAEVGPAAEALGVPAGRPHTVSSSAVSRYVLAYKGNSRQQCAQSRGPRASGLTAVHVVTESCSSIQLQSLLSVRLAPLCSSEDHQIQVSGTPLLALILRNRVLLRTASSELLGHFLSSTGIRCRLWIPVTMAT